MQRYFPAKFGKVDRHRLENVFRWFFFLNMDTTGLLLISLNDYTLTANRTKDFFKISRYITHEPILYGFELCLSSNVF